ncbi:MULTISPECIES: SPFH domain-containing protein [Vogesella]|uniref:Protease n=1 Tax=Vogesella alkaliphila TaxID=1193621 RepID=A0ABQ2YML3_9NEIS|nr:MULTISPECIES: SPFH domain-containing protein [Vogesella]MDC7703923.1 SPFH domain-containing protein [Vogesella indigofera]MDC7712257.1 SPFH domain-containing protein [Vogesella indigofera]GGX89149.1 protease [Vogesella alkaliphila]
MAILILFGLVTLIVIAGLRVIDQQTLAIVETFGKFARVLTPGLNWIIPGVQRIACLMDLRVQELSAQVEVKTRDNMFVTLPVAIMVRVIPERAADAFYQLASPQEQVKTWVLNTLRSSTAAMTLMNMYEDRDELAQQMQASLAERMGTYGYEIVSVLIDQPTVSEEVQHAFNSVIASERKREAAVQEAEAKRILIVGEARAEAESQQLRAEGLARARTVLAASLTEAIAQAKGSGISENDIMYLLLETNRLDTVKYASEKGKLVLMDLRAPASQAGLQIPLD